MEGKSDCSDPGVLAVESLRIGFEEGGHVRLAANGVSFHIDRRERVGLIGESGAGKSVTALSLCGLLEGKPGVFEGRVFLRGRDLYEGLPKISRARSVNGGVLVSKNRAAFDRIVRKSIRSIVSKEIGLVFQEPKESLDPLLSVGEQLDRAMLERVGAKSKPKRDQEADQLLVSLGFESPGLVRLRYPHELSGGMAQRVGLALVLSRRPQLLIADEPTSALDTITQKEIADALLKRHEDPESTWSLLLITHNLRFGMYLTERILVMLGGRLLECVTNAEIADAKVRLHPYTEDLLWASHELHGKCGSLQSRFEDLSRRSENANQPLSPALGGEGGHPGGCPYAGRCRIQVDLGEGTKRKCLEELPPMTRHSGSHSMRCWAY